MPGLNHLNLLGLLRGWLRGSLKLGEKISHGKGAMDAMDQKNQGQIYKWSREIQ